MFAIYGWAKEVCLFFLLYKEVVFMLIVTTDTIHGKNLEALGFVQGVSVQTKNALKDIGAGLKNMFGGSLGAYEKLLDEATTLAVNKLTEQAGSKGADAVVGVRFFSPSVMDGAAEVVAYGTAVKFV